MTTLSAEKSTKPDKSGVDTHLSKEEKIELFFTKKAEEAAIFMKNNPIPYELTKQAWDERKLKNQQ